jgi:hypothetical protein
LDCVTKSSARQAKLQQSERRDAALDGHHYGEVDVVLLFIDDAAQRAAKAAAELRASGAEDFLVEALERTREELETGRRLTQGTSAAREDPSARAAGLPADALTGQVVILRRGGRASLTSGSGPI